MSRARPHLTARPVGPILAVQLAPAALVQVARRADPALSQAPLVCADEQGRVVAASDEAQGVGAGHTTAQARAACPALEICAPDAAGARRLYEDLLATLATASPLVEATSPAEGLACLDAAGSARLWGCREDTWDGRAAGMGLGALLRRRGMQIRIGIAWTPLHARLLAARAAPGAIRAVTPAIATRVISRLSLADELGSLIPPQVLATLRDVGITTVGALLALPQPAVQARFGPALATLCRDLRGDKPAPLVPWTPRPAVRVTQQIEGSDNMLALEHCLEALTARLAALLEQAGQTATTLALEVVCEDQSRHYQDSHHWPGLQTPLALRRAAVALLERCVFAAPVVELACRATDLEAPQTAQVSLLTATEERTRAHLAALIRNHERRSGHPLCLRWVPDPLAEDGWRREDGPA